MELTGADLDRIPARNVRVPVVEFARVWVAAERQLAEDQSWGTFGVVATCRWLAGASVPNITGGREMAKAPVTRRSGSAYEELIAAECQAAEAMLFRRPVPPRVLSQPGWLEAVVATLAWAWRRTGPAPITVPESTRG
ncbi:hypothetical protein BAY61_01350 [Prauserella marina]|uniref:Uncharacterized protein n=1 Tax=Prauserella marina TaxID=530584 RepID=A0A222VIV3_9PSEU|nr:hypothetical protein [Prauserella marina]ASR33855.1 hypothetical protein BAY61_01350 [Prauserella marina]PWV82444.1 hypothetical protein DES30_102687 [Prauserella marina]SDC69364.1 hypothetical protein SAMN05421630_103223 [Prauserella marina]